MRAAGRVCPHVWLILMGGSFTWLHTCMLAFTGACLPMPGICTPGRRMRTQGWRDAPVQASQFSSACAYARRRLSHVGSDNVQARHEAVATEHVQAETQRDAIVIPHAIPASPYSCAPMRLSMCAGLEVCLARGALRYVGSSRGSTLALWRLRVAFESLAHFVRTHVVCARKVGAQARALGD